MNFFKRLLLRWRNVEHSEPPATEATPEPPKKILLGYAILIRKNGRLHPVLDRSKGEGAMAIFSTAAQAEGMRVSLAVCQSNDSFVLAIER